MKQTDIKNSQRAILIAQELNDLSLQVSEGESLNSNAKEIKQFISKDIRLANNLLDRYEDPERVARNKNLIEKCSNTDKSKIFKYKVKSINSYRRRRRIILSSVSSIAAAIIFISFLISDTIREDNNMRLQDAFSASEMEFEKPVLISQTNKIIDLDNISSDISYKGVNIKNKDNKLTYNAEKTLDTIESKHNILIVPKANTYTLVLSDGTEVIVNANSRIRYPVVFDKGQRRIELSGEAYFKVKSDKNRPFIVVTNEVEVKVYGTEFNVETNVVNGTLTTLVEGSVGIKAHDYNKEYIIEPGEKLTYNRNKKGTKIEKVNLDIELAWLSGKFCCDGEPFSNILSKIENWYGIKLEYGNVNISNEKVSVNLNRKTELNELIKIIQKLMNVTITKKTEVIYVINNK